MMNQVKVERRIQDGKQVCYIKTRFLFRWLFCYLPDQALPIIPDQLHHPVNYILSIYWLALLAPSYFTACITPKVIYREAVNE